MKNDEVTFDLQEGKKGLNAVNVKRAWRSIIKSFMVFTLPKFSGEGFFV
ncbi:MAG: hypothetical protein MZV63_09620 [Marinilabiliales bacterium]|nr:hypothetical protein [Marinilabiliales bacterium]